MLESKQIAHEIVDLDTIDGLAEAAYHNIMTTPTVLVQTEDGREHKFAGDISMFQQFIAQCTV
jgi:hypothetical protein